MGTGSGSKVLGKRVDVEQTDQFTWLRRCSVSELGLDFQMGHCGAPAGGW